MSLSNECNMPRGTLDDVNKGQGRYNVFNDAIITVAENGP